MNALSHSHSLPVIALASPVYWPNAAELESVVVELRAGLQAGASTPLDVRLVRDLDEVRTLKHAWRGQTAVLLPLSGAVQPWLVELGDALAHVALANAYLPGFLAPALSGRLLERNAHPACTDFYAHRRRHGRPARWLGTLGELHRFAAAHQAVARLRAARFLKIGETEPWVINSTREPDRFRAALGCEVLPLEAKVLYEEFARVDDDEAAPIAADWMQRARSLDGPATADVRRAARVLVAMRRLLGSHQADALSMACFAMIAGLDTTSCIALSALNDSADAIGACEGDLDAAVTLFLLKALGADFVWIANPIVHAENWMDLAHCTAPRCACGTPLPYRLLRHHESGRGVAPEVTLPADRPVTLARIGADLTELTVHPGWAARVAKQPTCHTQVRVKIPSSRRFLDCLNGTHVVMSYGDHGDELACCAELLGLRLTGTLGEAPVITGGEAPPASCPACVGAGAALTTVLATG
jgi:hypothetical protein